MKASTQSSVAQRGEVSTVKAQLTYDFPTPIIHLCSLHYFRTDSFKIHLFIHSSMSLFLFIYFFRRGNHQLTLQIAKILSSYNPLFFIFYTSLPCHSSRTGWALSLPHVTGEEMDVAQGSHSLQVVSSGVRTGNVAVQSLCPVSRNWPENTDESACKGGVGPVSALKTRGLLFCFLCFLPSSSPLHSRGGFSSGSDANWGVSHNLSVL